MVQSPLTDSDLGILISIFAKRRESKALLLFLRNQYGLARTTVHRRAYRAQKKKAKK